MRMLLAGLLLTLMGTSQSSAEDAPKRPTPPKGYSWKTIEAVNMTFLMPDGWHFRQDSQKDTTAFFITREKIDPKSGKGFEVGLSVNVVRKLKQKGLAEKIAKDTVLAQAENKVLSKWQGKQDKLISYGCLAVMDIGDGGSKVQTHLLTIANSETNTLYIVQFESPEKEWDAAWKIGEPMLKKFAMDPEK